MINIEKVLYRITLFIVFLMISMLVVSVAFILTPIFIGLAITIFIVIMIVFIASDMSSRKEYIKKKRYK